MTKKRKSSKKSLISGLGIRGILILTAVVIVVGLVAGQDTAINLACLALDLDLPLCSTEVAESPTSGEPLAAQSSGSDEGGSNVEVTSGSGDFWDVYFTNPVIPFDDVVTGGNEQYIITLINNAQSSIDTAMFEFDLQSVADALIAAHNRGVVVRVVYDDEHTEEDPQIEELLDAGIPGVPDERSAFMHNKFYVIDRQIVWTGSMNFTENGVYRNNNNAVAIRSTKLAENYTAEFEEMFADEFGPRSPSNTPNPSFSLDGVLIENYFAPEDEVLPNFIRVISEAQTSIHIMIFSFTEDDLGAAVRERLGAGVEVAGIFEGRGANTEYSECVALINAGADIRIDINPRTFHHKVIIIDGTTVALGSFNFSNNATTSNDENLLIIHDAGLAAQYEAEFNRHMATAVVPNAGECLKPK